MKSKLARTISSLLVLTAMMILPYFVFAQTNTGAINKDSKANPLTMLNSIAAGENGPYQTADQNSLAVILGLVINAALTLLGLLFIILMVIAGYNWMTASGNEDRVDKAKDTIKRAIIGLVIVLGSWAIWNFILNRFIAKL